MNEEEIIKSNQIHQRKIELVKRDPLAQEWNRLVRKKTDEAEEIGKEIMAKWRVNLMQDPSKSLPEPLSYLRVVARSHPTVIDATDYIKECLLPRIKRLTSQDRKHLEGHGWIFFPTEGGYERGNTRNFFYIPITADDIPIIIDPGGVNEKNITKVVDQVNHILKKRIKERKSKIKPDTIKSKQSNPIPQAGEPPELGFIYSSKDVTFKQHLKRYDLHMGGDLETPKGLRFRTIAFHEFLNNSIGSLRKRCPDKLEEAQGKIAELEKILKVVELFKRESYLKKKS